MRIEGTYGDACLTYVSAFLISEKPTFRAPIRLYVDTGASKTIINDLDAYKLGIRDHAKESPKSDLAIRGIGGTPEAYYIENCTLNFQAVDGSIQTEHLDKIYVLKHHNFNKMMSCSCLVYLA